MGTEVRCWCPFWYVLNDYCVIYWWLELLFDSEMAIQTWRLYWMGQRLSSFLSQPMEVGYHIEVQLISLSFCGAVAVIPLNICELWHGIFHEDLKYYRRVSDAWFNLHLVYYHRRPMRGSNSLRISYLVQTTFVPNHSYVAGWTTESAIIHSPKTIPG